MMTVASYAGEELLISFIADAIELQSAVSTITKYCRTVHKCFQASSIIGRSKPSPSWRGITGPVLLC